MVTRQFWNVHTAPVAHVGTEDALRIAASFEGRGVVIPDGVAQTIASWWHSPQSPYSTRLSTGGHVDRYLTMDDIASDAERENAPEADQTALDALARYITHHQDNAPSGVRPCACHDCFDDVVGKVGELCHECTEHGCDAQFTYSCDRPNAYAEQSCDGGAGCVCEGCHGCEDDSCLFCVPGV